MDVKIFEPMKTRKDAEDYLSTSACQALSALEGSMSVCSLCWDLASEKLHAVDEVDCSINAHSLSPHGVWIDRSTSQLPVFWKMF